MTVGEALSAAMRRRRRDWITCRACGKEIPPNRIYCLDCDRKFKQRGYSYS